MTKNVVFKNEIIRLDAGLNGGKLILRTKSSESEYNGFWQYDFNKLLEEDFSKENWALMVRNFEECVKHYKKYQKAHLTKLEEFVVTIKHEI